MNKEFPCKVCTHPAYKHYVNVTKEDFICTGCLDTEKGRNCIDPSEYRHEFVGDNFKYLELLDKREEIKNEQ
jgi:hypothetical protein